jgi:peptide/nickel transport system permease protein
MNMEFIKTARAKGLAESRVVAKHAFRNACIPVITVLGLQFGQLLGGAIITETVFAWPGVATLTVESIRNQGLSGGASARWSLLGACSSWRRT